MKKAVLLLLAGLIMISAVLVLSSKTASAGSDPKDSPGWYEELRQAAQDKAKEDNLTNKEYLNLIQNGWNDQEGQRHEGWDEKFLVIFTSALSEKIGNKVNLTQDGIGKLNEYNTFTICRKACIGVSSEKYSHTECMEDNFINVIDHIVRTYKDNKGLPILWEYAEKHSGGDIVG
jgi:hypothetical protein